MKNIDDIKNTLAKAAPGTEIHIKGYKGSSGEKRNIKAELLTLDDYPAMQQADVDILREADEADLLSENDPDVSTADILTARDQLIASRVTALAQREAGTSSYRGPNYESIGGSLAVHPDEAEEGIYIQRLKVLSPIPIPKPAKGAIPRAKQYISAKLDLPTRRYAHSLKLQDGKFDDLEVKNAVELPES